MTEAPKELEKGNPKLIKALGKIYEKDRNWRHAVIILPSEKAVGSLDIRLYNADKKKLSASATTVAIETVSEELERRTAIRGWPVFQVVVDKNGTYSLRHVDTKLTPYYSEAPDGAYDEVKVDF